MISFGFLRLQLQQLQYAIFHLPFTVFLNVTNRRDFFTFFSLRFTAESFFLHSSAMKTGWKENFYFLSVLESNTENDPIFLLSYESDFLLWNFVDITNLFFIISHKSLLPRTRRRRRKNLFKISAAWFSLLIFSPQTSNRQHTT